MPSPVTVRRYAGPQVRDVVPALARLRILVFREYPYLYDGDLSYEERYLRTYADSPRSAVVVAFDGDRVVGASTGLPLADEPEEIRRPFVDQGHDLGRIFYCGESVLRREYRGQGLGVRFFEEREAHARELGLPITCFCAVVRPADHPLRPPGYVPLDAFWRRRGYEPRPELRATISWKELGEEEETPKPMAFWMKRLGAG